MHPCLTLSIIRYASRVKWSNPGKGVASSPTPQCSSFWKGSLQVALDYSHQLYLLYYKRCRLISGTKNYFLTKQSAVFSDNLGIKKKIEVFLILSEKKKIFLNLKSDRKPANHTLETHMTRECKSRIYSNQLHFCNSKKKKKSEKSTLRIEYIFYVI